MFSGETALTDQALTAIGPARSAGNPYVSPITAWELSVATQSPRQTGRPYLGNNPVDRWFREAVRATTAKIIPTHQKIALEAAGVVLATGYKDPGDCLRAARFKKIPIVTQDHVMRNIAPSNPDYLTVVC